MAEAINLARGTGARPRALATLFVAIVAVAAYARTLTFGYVWDDHDLVARNPLVQGQAPWRAIWTTHLFGGGEPSERGRYYRPLALASFRLNRALSAAPWSFHLVNVVLHGLCTALVLQLALAAGARLSVAVGAALLFCLWSGHTETVAWISGRPDLLATCGVVVMLWAAAGLWRGEPVGSGPRGLAASTGAVLAILSKEPGIAVVATMVLLLMLNRAETGWRRRAGWALALTVVLCAGAALRGYALAGAGEPVDRIEGGVVARLARLGAQLALFSGLDMRLFVDVPAGLSSRLGLAACALASLGALLWLAMRGWRDRRVSSAAILLGVAALVPVAWARAPALRYAYLPLALLSGGLAPAVARVADRLTPAAVVLPAAALGLVWTGMGQARLGAWRDGNRLFALEAAQNPENPDAQLVVGMKLLARGQNERAARQFERVLETHPRHRSSLLGLAEAALRARSYERAEVALARSMREGPVTRQELVTLGRIRLARGESRRALDAFRRALGLEPEAVDALEGARAAALAAGNLELAGTYGARLDRVRAIRATIGASGVHVGAGSARASPSR